MNTYYLACCCCPINSSYVLLSNKIALLMDVLLHQLTVSLCVKQIYVCLGFFLEVPLKFYCSHIKIFHIFFAINREHVTMRPMKSPWPFFGVSSCHSVKIQTSSSQTIAQPFCSYSISSLRERESIGSLHRGDMSAYILQHSVRRTVNISLLQTSNSGSSLGPPVLAAQTGQGAGTELWYMHELYWGSSSAEFQSKAVIFP